MAVYTHTRTHTYTHTHTHTHTHTYIHAHKHMLSLLDFDRSCTRWLTTIFKIMFESMFIKVAEA